MHSPIPRLGQELGALAMFAVVAEERSFTKTAVRLGVSRSAVSHGMRALEERLGLRLVARTTRAVSVTEAGQRLLARLGPALESIDAALLDVGELRDRPTGRIRLIAPPIVLSTLLSPKLAAFTRTYPEIVLDITSEDDTRGELVARRYDAGVHLGEFLQRDMTAVRVTREQRAAVVAAPSYFEAHPKPKKPSDITAHRCVIYRMGPDGPIYRWEFEKRGKPVSVSASGPVIVSDAQFMIRAALDGVGLAYILEDYVADHIARGDLVRVLEDWCPPFDGYFLYYPSRRQQSPALQALVAALRV
jgi:DNA-binding transcriptional LysR family regulator